MMKHLNPLYFNLVTQEERGENIYKVYRPLYTAMGLYSIENNIPLFILQLKPKDIKAKALIYQRPAAAPAVDSKQIFHGMIDKDEQAFSFVITNPTAYYIYYDVSYSKGFYDESLNEVNVIRPLSSDVVSSARHAGHLELILASIEVETGSSLSVAEDEKSAKENKTEKKGVSFKLSVSPQDTADRDVTTLFSGPMEWRSIDHLIFSNLESSTMAIPMAHYLADEGDYRPAVKLLRSSAPSNKPPTTDREWVEASSSARGEVDLGGIKEWAIPSNTDMYEAGEMVETSAKLEQVILESKAAILKYGEKVTVNCEKLNIPIAFYLKSPACELGLSVAIGLEFQPDSATPEERRTAACLLIDAHVNNKIEDFLTKATHYISEQCCICMKDNLPPDLIFYKCGHCCAHVECIKNVVECPFCRKPIEARLKLPVLASRSISAVSPLTAAPISVSA